MKKKTNGTPDERVVMIPEDLYNRTCMDPVAKWYIINAEGVMVFIKVRDRKLAQEIIDNIYGRAFYIVKAMFTDHSGDRSRLTAK